MYVLWLVLFVVPMAVFGLALLAVLWLVALFGVLHEALEQLLVAYDDSYDG